MKSVILYSLLVFNAVTLVAQDACKGYFAYEEGTKWTMTSYNKNKKKTSEVTYELLFHENENGQDTYTFSYETFDKDQEKMSSGEFTGTCSENTFTSSVSGLFTESMPETPDVQIEITGDFIQYPRDMVAGQKLPDAQIIVASSIENGMNLFKATTDITNRKVIGKEKIVTPAGTFECLKISYDAKIKMIISRSIQVVEYVADGIGVVRSEQYDKKGELAGYSEITALSKS